MFVLTSRSTAIARAWPPVALTPPARPAPRNPGTAAAVLSDVCYLRGMERLHGRETLAALALELGHEVDAALEAGDTLAVARLAKELRQALAALGRPQTDAVDDRPWLETLTSPE